MHKNLTNYANLVLISDGEADVLVIKEALFAGLGIVISQYATAYFDSSQLFIKVIPINEINNKDFIDNAQPIEKYP